MTSSRAAWVIGLGSLAASAWGAASPGGWSPSTGLRAVDLPPRHPLFSHRSARPQPGGQPESPPADVPQAAELPRVDAGAGAEPAAQPVDPEVAPAPHDVNDPVVSAALAGLLDDGNSEAARLDAARTLVARIGTDEGRMAVTVLLGPGAEDVAAKWLLVRALAREAWLPESMLDPLLGALPGAEGERLARALSAIASIRTPRALRAVAEYLEPPSPEATRSAALAALVRATGRDELGSTRASWLDWIAQAEHADPSDGVRPTWSAWLVRGLADRAERLSQRSRDLAARLTDAQRRLYVSTAPDQRSAILGGLLRDDLPELRALGFELLERELVTTPTPGPEVVSAVMGLLTHPLASVRAQAASLVARIAPEGAGEAVANALVVEEDPAAAAALLSAAARWPSEAIREPVLRWLSNGPGTRPVAADAALAMHRANRWSSQDLEQVAGAMRRVNRADLTPAGIRLIAHIGTLEDRLTIIDLLSTGSPAQRAAVADALAPRPEHLDAILAAAGQDATLIPAASRAVAAHRPTLAGFRAVVRLPGGSEGVRGDALRTVGEVLGTGDLLSAADEVGGDNATVLWLLERALLRSQQAVAAGEPGATELLLESAERLARRRLDLGRPAEAIAALDVIPEQTPASRLTTLRAVALLVLGRLTDARALGVGADAWLDALDRCLNAAHAPDILATIRQEFAGRLTDAQNARLEDLARRVPGREAPPPG